MTNARDLTRKAAGAHPPALPPPDSQADRLLRLVHWTSAASRHLRRRLAEVAASFDLSDNELLVVWLANGEGHVQVDLAAATGISPAQMSGMAERLRSRGLLGMHRQALDRRRQVWRTSAAGKSLLAQLTPHLEQLADEVREAMAFDELHAAQLCERLAGIGGEANRRAGRKPEPPRTANEPPQTKEAA